MRALRIPFSRRACALALCAAGVLLGSTAIAATQRSQAVSEARKTYLQDRAACLNGQTGEDRPTCLREAGAAYDEARRGRLGTDDGDFERNRLRRCDRQPPGEREYCIRRMNGEGVVSGSVAGGGILRELTVVVPAAPQQSN